MQPTVIFDKVTQNSVLISQIFLIPSSVPDYVFIKIEAKLITPIDTVKILSSLPLFYEPGNLNFFYKCLIPYNCLPSFDSEYYKIEYKLILTEFKGHYKNDIEFPFEVHNNPDLNEYKYDIFLDSDMIRIDNKREDNETGFSEIVKYLRYHIDFKCGTDNINIVDKISNINIIDKTDNINIVDKISNTNIVDKTDNIKKEIICKIYKLKDYTEIFKNIIKKYKDKGDLYFHIKKYKKLDDKILECEIKNEGEKILSLNTTKYLKRKWY